MSAMSGQEPPPPGNPYYNAAQSPQQAPTPLGPPTTQEESQKRKSTDEPSAAGQRAKRNRYVSIACNECKRRKIKCNGEQPCGRCSAQELACIYVPNCCNSGFRDSQEYREMSDAIRRLQDEVNELHAIINPMRGSAGPYAIPSSLAPGEAPAGYRNATSPTRSRASHSQFQGPTSAQYNFDVAKSSLQTMGISEPEMPEEGNGVEIDPALGAPQQQRAPMAPMVTHSPKDPLWKLEKDEAVRMCKVYEEEMGMMYPMLDMDQTIAKTVALFDLMDTAREAGLVGTELPGIEHMESNDVDIIKMVIANGILVEAYGNSDLGRELYESCREAFESNLSKPVEIKRLILLVVVAEYHFQQDEENHAYRLIGFATRLCLEIGLHRRQTLLKSFPDPVERSWVVKLFWSIYVMDRRWSLGMGRPFSLQDSDIDPQLPQPDDGHPYLSAMISYSRLASKVWQSTGNFESSSFDIDIDQIKYLDNEIIQWNISLPEDLRFYPATSFNDGSSIPRGKRRLQVILYLRTNQMLMQIYRPILLSATGINENSVFARKAVDVAKDTVRVLSHLNAVTDIYRTQQVCFNYFLITSLGVLFLAVCHAPLDFGTSVRDEFYQTLDLVRGFSSDSYIAQRLWNTIRGLKEVAPKLGLISRQMKLTDSSDPHSNAAVAMAGLAGHRVDEMAAYASARQSSTLDGSPMNGQQMSYELTHLFEAAGGNAQAGHAATQQPDRVNGYSPQATKHEPGISPVQGPDALRGIDGHEADVSRILGGLF